MIVESRTTINWPPGDDYEDPPVGSRPSGLRAARVHALQRGHWLTPCDPAGDFWRFKRIRPIRFWRTHGSRWPARANCQQLGSNGGVGPGSISCPRHDELAARRFSGQLHPAEQPTRAHVSGFVRHDKVTLRNTDCSTKSVQAMWWSSPHHSPLPRQCARQLRRMRVPSVAGATLSMFE
jgi:hypothetical protein